MSEPNYDSETEYFDDGPVLPGPGVWIRHVFFLLLTFVTSTIAGVLYPFGVIPIMPEADPQTWVEATRFIADLPLKYAELVGGTIYLLFTDIGVLTYGLSFSLSLLFILLSHEMGHYIACRIYRVDATLPLFIPTPPMIGPAGTFGAFIKIRSAFPSRNAIFDIGVAGPIAGFVALIPIALIGLATSAPTGYQPEQGGLVFAHPLLIKFLAPLFGIDLSAGIGNAFYFAAWVGLLVTALNLIPSGQLDGGHAIFAVLGERVHYWTGRIAFAIMAALSILGLIFYNSPSGFLVAVLLGIMMRLRHPRPWDDTPLDTKRKIIALLTLLIFAVSFLPFPIRIL